MIYALYGLIGLLAGISSGLFGIGGGLISVPLLVFLTKVSQHTAAGMSLIALLMPVGLLGVFEYYNSGKITKTEIVYGLVIGLGLFLGCYIGAKLGLGLSEPILRRLFAVFIILVGIRMLVMSGT